VSTHRRGPRLKRTEAREEFLEKAEDLWDRFNERYDAHPEATSDEMEELGRQPRAVSGGSTELNLKQGDLGAMVKINGIPG
jgi:hypothetical protein